MLMSARLEWHFVHHLLMERSFFLLHTLPPDTPHLLQLPMQEPLTQLTQELLLTLQSLLHLLVPWVPLLVLWEE